MLGPVIWVLGGTVFTGFGLREYLPNKFALCIGVSLAVGLEAFDKFAFKLRISAGILWMLAKPIAEEQLLRSVRRRANVDVMRTTATKRWHTFDEEHPVHAWILRPVDIAKTRKWCEQTGPN